MRKQCKSQISLWANAFSFHKRWTILTILSPMIFFSGNRLRSITHRARWTSSTSRSTSRLVSWSSAAGLMMGSRWRWYHGDDGQDGLGVRKEYLRNNDDDDDRNIYPRNEHLLSVIDIKEDDQWDTGESPFIIYIIIMMMIFKKMTNDDIQVDLRHQDAAESQMRSNVRLKSESQSRVSDNHQSILLHQWFRDGSGYQDKWIFGKLPKRGGVIFNQKIYVADFGT